MGLVKNFFHLLIALAAFILTFRAFGSLTYFLSKPLSLSPNASKLTFKEVFSVKETYYGLFLDSILASAFVLLHSFLNTSFVKKCLLNSIAHRCIYNIFSSAALLILINNWVRIPYVLWYVDLDNFFLQLAYYILHVTVWLIIYGGSLLMDLPELLGIKQIYYDMRGLHQPDYYKSKDLKKLYSRLRHPSFVCLALVLWGTNFFSFDRLILASLWTVYMFIAWNPDYSDYNYQKNQLAKKRKELEYSFSN